MYLFTLHFIVFMEHLYLWNLMYFCCSVEKPRRDFHHGECSSSNCEFCHIEHVL